MPAFRGLVTPFLSQLPHNTSPSFSSLYDVARQVAPFPLNKALNIGRPVALDLYDFLHPPGTSMSRKGLLLDPRLQEMEDQYARFKRTDQQYEKTFTFNRWKSFKTGITLFW